jgi:hypothetical protein
MDLGYQRKSIIASEDEDSLAGSEFSDSVAASTRVRRRRRSLRTSTRFAFAHPAPALRNKQRRLVQIRPRLLLQLQQVGDKRAIPAYDVVPSGLLAGSLIIPLLAKKCPRVFRAKPELDQSDVLIVRSDDYGSAQSEESHGTQGREDNLDHRDVLAVISTLPPDDDHADIVLEDGSVWVTSRMMNGSYEFTRTDAQGTVTTARWVKRASPLPPISSTEEAAEILSERKWTFSIINPETRRHPILGSLTPTSLDIYDTYSTMSTASGHFPPTRPIDSDAALSGDSAPSSPRITTTAERMMVAVTEEEKKVMVATAIWIGLRQDGWPASANPKFAKTAAHCRSASIRNLERARSFSGVGNNLGMACTLTGSTLGSSASSDTASQQHPALPRPRRAMSTGAAFMENRRRLSGVPPAHDNVAKETRQTTEEKTPTCRFRMRELAERLFHRKSSQAKSQSSLKYQLKE